MQKIAETKKSVTQVVKPFGTGAHAVISKDMLGKTVRIEIVEHKIVKPFGNGGAHTVLPKRLIGWTVRIEVVGQKVEVGADSIVNQLLNKLKTYIGVG